MPIVMQFWLFSTSAAYRMYKNKRKLFTKVLEKLRHEMATSFCKSPLENLGQRSKELSNEVKEMIVKSANHTPYKVELARMFGIPFCNAEYFILMFILITYYSTIVSVLDKFHMQGNVENMPRSGRRLSFTTVTPDKVKLSHLVKYVKANRRKLSCTFQLFWAHNS
jgi:hypothetical protein